MRVALDLGQLSTFLDLYGFRNFASDFGKISLLNFLSFAGLRAVWWAVRGVGGHSYR